VFVLGQGVPEDLEVDGLDPGCTHFVARLVARAIGTARLRDADGSAKAERVAVLEAARGAGAGSALMEVLEAEARGRGYPCVILSAQEAVIPFYARLGYGLESERFFEAGIPHRKMRKLL
jgi:predicted GNAT family N-acyltransferase